MAAAPSPDFLTPVLVFCTAAVLAVPLARRAGLSAVIGYLVAGAMMGPFGLGFVNEPATISGVAELGVVLLQAGRVQQHHLRDVSGPDCHTESKLNVVHTHMHVKVE